MFKNTQKLSLVLYLVRRYFWLGALLIFLAVGLVRLYSLISPLREANFILTEPGQLQHSTVKFVDRGGTFFSYVREYRRYLQQWRAPVEDSFAGAQAQIDWVAPYTRTVAADCRKIEAKALLIHGLYGSAYQMSNLATGFAKKCVQSQVMLLPGHGTRAADLEIIDAADYFDAVATRLRIFSADCAENCFVVGYSLGALLATMAILRGHDQLDGLVAIAPFWNFRMVDYHKILPVLKKWYPYNPWSRKKLLPTHYSYESVHGAAQTLQLLGSLLDTLRRVDTPPLHLPSLVVSAESDPFAGPEDVIAAAHKMFNPPPSLLIYARNVDEWNKQLSLYPSEYSIRSAEWPRLGVRELSHFSLVYSPIDLLYGLDGHYGACLEPVGFDCDRIPADVVYGKRSLTPNRNEATLASHPEFSHQVSTIVRFFHRVSRAD